jgi:hypothetical protein
MKNIKNYRQTYVAKYVNQNKPLPWYRVPEEQLLCQVKQNGGNRVEQTGSHVTQTGNCVAGDGNLSTRISNRPLLQAGVKNTLARLQTGSYQIVPQSENQFIPAGNYGTQTGNDESQHGNDVTQNNSRHTAQTGSICVANVNMGTINIRWREEEQKYFSMFAKLSKVTFSCTYV